MKRNLLVAVALLCFLATPGEKRIKAASKIDVSPYPSYAQMIDEIKQLAEDHQHVSLATYGKSVEGRDLLVLKISKGKDKPAAWIGAVIHGNEWIGNRTAMNIAHMLAKQDTKLAEKTLDEMDFYIAPCQNPDGYYRTWQQPCEDDNRPCRKNANGVDLNRNFPLPGKLTIPIDMAGSPEPDSIHYRGPEALSEPETRAIDRFFKEHPDIVAAISWHSYAAVMYPPHCETRTCLDRFQKACKAYRRNQEHLPYPRLQTRVFDTYTGEMEDWLYHEYGVMAVDIEIGTRLLNMMDCKCDHLFWVFNPQEPQWWIENDSKAALHYLLESDRIMEGKRIPPQER